LKTKIFSSLLKKRSGLKQRCRYDGQFSNNLKDGFGMYEWTDGTKYEGHFKEDRKVGDPMIYQSVKPFPMFWTE
jgi:hypothetical protein